MNIEKHTHGISMYFKIPLHQLLDSKEFLLLHPESQSLETLKLWWNETLHRHLVEATSAEGGFRKIQAVGNAAGEILHQTK